MLEYNFLDLEEECLICMFLRKECVVSFDVMMIVNLEFYIVISDMILFDMVGIIYGIIELIGFFI